MRGCPPPVVGQEADKDPGEASYLRLRRLRNAKALPERPAVTKSASVPGSGVSAGVPLVGNPGTVTNPMVPTFVPAAIPAFFVVSPAY